MNHDKVLETLASALNDTIKEFDADIEKITNCKIKVGCKQTMDKAVNWSMVMCKLLDDLNCYLSFFGGRKE